ncbi:MAG: hypothetical protein L3J39_06430, partial [Verrucomicrobiales bacterium]|nr:hypothetical protein [Verrucomicrobiales bacterium]
FSAATFHPHQADVTIKYFVQTERYEQLRDHAISWAVVEPTIRALRWEAEELLVLLAKRIRLFKFMTGRIEGDTISLTDLENPALAYNEWRTFLPAVVRNRALACDENSLVYFLRHTQLIPRQCIVSGNEVWEAFRKSKTTYITGKTVRYGIDSAERINSLDVLNAFSVFYPNADRMCEAILRGMDVVTTQDKILGSLDFKNDKRLSEYDEGSFIRLLCVSGIVGRKRENKRTDDLSIYDTALFECERDGTIQFSSREELVVHPMFQKFIGADRFAERTAHRPKAGMPKAGRGAIWFEKIKFVEQGIAPNA